MRYEFYGMRVDNRNEAEIKQFHTKIATCMTCMHSQLTFYEG